MPVEFGCFTVGFRAWFTVVCVGLVLAGWLGFVVGVYFLVGGVWALSLWLSLRIYDFWFEGLGAIDFWAFIGLRIYGFVDWLRLVCLLVVWLLDLWVFIVGVLVMFGVDVVW